MQENSSALSHDIAKLILRLSAGVLLFLYGIKKLGGIEAIKQAMLGLNLPEFVAYGVYLGELIAPILLILGLFTRLASLSIIITMIVAAIVASGGDIFALNKYGGWIIEVQALYIGICLALVFLGSGRFALIRKGLLAKF